MVEQQSFAHTVRNNMKLKYYFVVIILYLISVPYLLWVFRENLNYKFNLNILSLVVFLLTFIGSYIEVTRTKKKFNFKLLKINLITFALLFAFSEEIIFRGVIQGYLQTHLNNFWLPILISSGIFALAHLFNPANVSTSRYNWNFVKDTFLVGIPLGLLFTITNSLLIPTILHFLLILLVRVFTRD